MSAPRNLGPANPRPGVGSGVSGVGGRAGRAGRVRRPLARTFLLPVLLAIVATASLAVSKPAPIRAAQSGLTFTSASTWTAQPSKAAVHVAVDVTATSHTSDTAQRRYFYTYLPITVPPSTAHYTAAAGSTNLTVAVASTTSAGVELRVNFPTKLYNAQTYSFRLQFDLVDTGTATDRDLRIGKTVLSFPVYAFGTPGVAGSSTSVVFPAGYSVQQEFGGLTGSTAADGRTTYSSGKLSDATALIAWFTAEEPVTPADYRERSVQAGPLAVTLRYWSDDPAWANAIARLIETGYPVLRGIIGLGDPAAKSLVVEEASNLSMGGYGGLYDPSLGRVDVSYLADPFVTLHELAHLWFNADLASDRWIDEAFATYYGELAVNQLKLTDHAPQLTDALRAARIPLNDWAGLGQPTSASEQYAYAATLEVGRQIATIAGGPAALANVWRAIAAGRAPYQPVHGAKTEMRSASAPDWRSLLDYLEQADGKAFEPIWREWIVDASQVKLLDDRDRALAAYRATAAAAGAWDLPPEVRQALGAWQYGDAQVLLNEASRILAERDEIARRATAESTTAPPRLQTAFEHGGIAAAATEANAELDALDALTAAREAEGRNSGAARDVGLLGANPATELASARQAFAAGDLPRASSLANDARAAWEGATTAGRVRLLGIAAVGLGLVILILLALWWRRTRRGGSQPAMAASPAGPAGPSGRSGRGAGAVDGPAAATGEASSAEGIASGQATSTGAPAPRTGPLAESGADEKPGDGRVPAGLAGGSEPEPLVTSDRSGRG